MQRAEEITKATPRITSAHLFVGGFMIACAFAALVIGSFPLQLSIITIFLFAGPHNLMEFRYFAARMPVRWGRSRTYYSVGIVGVIVLTTAYVTLYFASGNWLWSRESWAVFAGVWNTAFILWIGLLVYLRGKQRVGRDWGWAIPAALLVAALAWLIPQYWSLSLVYLHPLIAMWFLERQIRRTRPEWLRAYHLCLLTIPLYLFALWFALAGRSNLSEETNLFWRIGQHAGSEILPSISSHLLVATHVFLETIHYFVWILLIPLVDKRAVPWRLMDVPVFSNSNGFPRVFAAFLVFAILAAAALWMGFTFDYTATRDIYFALAIGHVLAEFPFLVKML